ncbi:MAG TPA: hypothetical protein DGH68_02750 [Bacteroidetes bacterium]|nr:hypothetical protein [Bacteroidota bacterium]
MGQQQILFVILAVCIIGVAVSIGFISVTGHTLSDNRSMVEQDLRFVAKQVQEYVALTPEQGGGSVSFFSLSRLPDAMGRLGCPSSNAHGDFFLKKSESVSRLQIIGVGIEAGRDQKRPLRMVMTVWTDSTSLSVLN